MRCQPCKACRRPIQFIKTVSGRWMPCEIEVIIFRPLAFAIGQTGRVQTFVTEEGQTLKGIAKQAPATADDRFGFIPHWVNCPKAERFKTNR